MKKLLPLKIVIQIDSTNLSTRRKALDQVVKMMNDTGHRLPKRGQVIWDEQFSAPYWKVKVVDRVNFLPERSPKKSRA